MIDHVPDVLPADACLPEPVAEALRAPLVDQHGSRLYCSELDRATLDRALGAGAPPPGTTQLDSAVGLALRRWCSPVLGLQQHASPTAYLARRAELGAREATRALLRASGVTAFFVDAGMIFAAACAGEAAPPAELARLSGHAVHEVLRLEELLSEVAERGPSAAAFGGEFAMELELRSHRAGALTSVIARHGGLDIDGTPPEPGEVTAAASRWLNEGADPGRVEDVLLRHGVWSGLEAARQRKIPLQLHVGYGHHGGGSWETDLSRADPLLLAPFLEEARSTGVPIVLVDCYPFIRQAAWLATWFPNVYLDVGGCLGRVGAAAPMLIAEALELAPFHKLMFGTGDTGLPELTLLSAIGHRRGLASVIARHLAAGEWGTKDAARIARLVGADNARRVYRLAG